MFRFARNETAGSHFLIEHIGVLVALRRLDRGNSGLLTRFVQYDENCLKQALVDDGISLISQMLQINIHNAQINECECRVLRILVSGRGIIPDIQEDRIPLEFEVAGKVALFALRGYPEREELSESGKEHGTLASC